MSFRPAGVFTTFIIGPRGELWYLIGARYYDAEIARWISQDNNRLHLALGQTPYAYSHNNPENLIDPDGNASLPATLFLLASLNAPQLPKLVTTAQRITAAGVQYSTQIYSGLIQGNYTMSNLLLSSDKVSKAAIQTAVGVGGFLGTLGVGDDVISSLGESGVESPLFEAFELAYTTADATLTFGRNVINTFESGEEFTWGGLEGQETAPASQATSFEAILNSYQSEGFTPTDVLNSFTQAEEGQSLLRQQGRNETSGVKYGQSIYR